MWRQRISPEAAAVSTRRSSPGQQFSVLCLDLDGFKDVNDGFGHPVGDEVLNAVAKRLLTCVRDGDTVARFGGDEFAIIQLDSGQPESARTLATRLIDTLSQTFRVGDHEISIGCGIGVALAPGDGETAEILLRNADLALYRAKEEGRNQYRFYNPDMNVRIQERHQMVTDLRHALENGEFSLRYQPIIDLSANTITGFEAFLRWNHPKRGFISPADFIPVAEEIGLIVPLGEWILRQACKDAVSWPDHIKIAVNLSPVQFRSKRVAEAVFTALAISRLPARRLELEITEGLLLDRTEHVLTSLKQLRALGVRIALDDFGTGYSSLSYLQSFPFDKIKIDGSFIRKMNGNESSTAIIRAVANIGTSLGMTTTAEGVETHQQLEWVRSEGCTDVQGFLFSEPLPATGIVSLIEKLDAKDIIAA